MSGKVLEEQALEKKALEEKAVERKDVEDKAMEGKYEKEEVEREKAMEGKAIEGKDGEEDAGREKTNEGKAKEGKDREEDAGREKIMEGKAIEGKDREEKAGREKAVEGKDEKEKSAGKRDVSAVLLWWEIRKLCEVRMMWVFAILCVAFNVFFVMSNQAGGEYVSYVKEARDLTGSRMGKAFDKKAEELLDDDDRKDLLISETKGAEDLFETYDAVTTAGMYIGKYRITGWVADALEWKYAQQNGQVRKLAAQDASLDAAAAGMTKQLLDILFGRLCRIVIAEGWILAVFLALYICGSERMSRTWTIVYASRRGRSIHVEKYIAGCICALGAYAAIAFVSSAVFAGVWRLGEIWETNMSTQFYYVYVAGIKVPFVPWISFHMWGYLGAVLALGAVVVALFYGIGYTIGLLTKNSYAGFLLLFIVLAVNFEVVMLAGDSAQWMIYEAAMWSPLMLWWLQPLWFSDMGINALVPWQESLTAALCLLVSAVLLMAGMRFFYRKDLK